MTLKVVVSVVARLTLFEYANCCDYDAMFFFSILFLCFFFFVFKQKTADEI